MDKALIAGERVLYEANISVWSLFPLIALGVILSPLGVGLILLIAAYIRYKSTELAITNKRIIAKFGFISRTTVELNLQKAESVQVHQGVLGRVFDFASIVIAGGGTPQAPIPGISRPLEFRRAFLAAQEQALAGRVDNRLN